MKINQLTAIRIKVLRIQLGFSAEVVAAELKIDKSKYSRLENGKVEITITRLTHIAQVLKVPVVDLLPYQDIQQSNNINADPALKQTLYSAISILEVALQKINNQ